MDGWLPIATMRTLLADAVARAGSQAAWARDHGITCSEVSETLNSKRPISPRIIEALGYVKSEFCRPMKDVNHV